MFRKVLLTGLIYGSVLGLLTTLMVWGKYRFLMLDHAMELYAGLIAVIFGVTGAWVGRRLMTPGTTRPLEPAVLGMPMPALPLPARGEAIPAQGTIGISPREHDVLQLLARGLSNEEIAEALFVSPNTVKTHLSNLYFKLDVKRRTQAVDKARGLGLISDAAPAKG